MIQLPKFLIVKDGKIIFSLQMQRLCRVAPVFSPPCRLSLRPGSGKRFPSVFVKLVVNAVKIDGFKISPGFQGPTKENPLEFLE